MPPVIVRVAMRAPSAGVGDPVVAIRARGAARTTTGRSTAASDGRDRAELSAVGRRLAATAAAGGDLTRAERMLLRELRRRDREVRAHERMHLVIAGRYARGGVRLEYRRGPDGRLYAVGGAVDIDTGEARTPEQTIEKMETVQRAALAPARPSSADRAIAARAALEEMEARQELRAGEGGDDAEGTGGSEREAEDSATGATAAEEEDDQGRHHAYAGPAEDFYRALIGAGRRRVEPEGPLRIHDILHPETGR